MSKGKRTALDRRVHRGFALIVGGLLAFVLVLIWLPPWPPGGSAWWFSLVLLTGITVMGREWVRAGRAGRR
ncbi:hypothetical protein AB0I28_32585 [Phytomonospora sp. NPDC050363]|uniref:hypothetical protein n=1 Tax=Phytomonospora sp. NPDC050363 TaxID=3155642 RepID=UPI0033D4CA8A